MLQPVALAGDRHGLLRTGIDHEHRSGQVHAESEQPLGDVGGATRALPQPGHALRSLNGAGRFPTSRSSSRRSPARHDAPADHRFIVPEPGVAAPVLLNMTEMLCLRRLKDGAV